MKTYFCVTTTFDDRGRVAAGLTNQAQFNEKPESTFRETRTKDIYIDWFDTLAEAMKFIEDARKA